MLTALTKCEENYNVEPPKSEILFASNIDSSPDGVAHKKSRNQNTQSILIEDVIGQKDNQLTGTALSCMSSFSGLPRFTIDIDQKLSSDRLSIVKKKLELQTLQRRLTYLAEFYYRELLGTISWAKDLPGKMLFLVRFNSNFTHRFKCTYF